MAATAERAEDAVARALEVLPGVVRLLSQAAAGGDGGALTLTQFRLLRRLSERVRLTSELAGELEVTPATVSAAIDALVRRGLVQRLSSPADRRAVPLAVTESGRAALEAARRRQQVALAALVDLLTPRERRGLEVGLAGLQRALAARGAR